MAQQRSIIGIVPSQETSDGAGVRLKRSVGSQKLSELDPFLLLDEFGSEDGADYIAGFPDHPHRGFETVTYMLDGLMKHEDHKGNAGILRPGGAQWMTAGRGIIHSEMPQQEDGLMRGFQLWVNLPAAEKMCEPRYQNLEPTEIPEVTTDDGVRIRVIAGEALGVEGAVDGIAVKPLYLDIAIPEGGRYRQPVPLGHTAFAYAFEGTADIGGDDQVSLLSGCLAVLGDGDTVEIAARDGAARLILVAGQPLHEPIVRYGPFVMNSREEIVQAFRDYEAGRF
jgi:hypothetical protein